MVVNSTSLSKQFEDIVRDMDFRSEENLSSLHSDVLKLKSANKVDDGYKQTLANVLLDKARDLKLVDRLDDEAYKVFQTVLIIDPENADAHYHQAWLDYFKENITEAMSHFEMALT